LLNKTFVLSCDGREAVELKVGHTKAFSILKTPKEFAFFLRDISPEEIPLLLLLKALKSLQL
jgi:hypothetical protein